MAEKEFVRQYRQSLLSAKIKDAKSLGEYFLYYAPGINSALCHEAISPDHEEEVAVKLLKVSRANSNQIQFGNRNQFSRSKEEMSTATFKSPSIYCHQKRGEGKASCLLRHLRNAIAHGEVYIKVLRNNSAQICFLDYDQDGKPSAQIITTRAVLEKWREILGSLGVDSIVPKGASHENR